MLVRWIRAYTYTIIFSTLIALLMWQVEGKPIQVNLIISLCIGLSICTISIALVATRRIEPKIRSVLTPAIGLCIGVVLSGWILYGDALYYLQVAPWRIWIMVFFGTVGSTIYVSYLRLKSAKKKLADAAEKETQQAEQALQAQLKLLQVQIVPHFLFNTLSNIHSLIAHRPQDAQRTLENLSVLLRRSLEQTDEQFITLQMEFKILRAYLDIQKIRMGDKLQYQLDIPKELYQLQIPSLLLQPLVENAVIHGLNTVEGGSVEVRVRQAGDLLHISVTDDGFGIQPACSTTGTHGIGLKNTRERLGTLYDEAAEIKLTDRSNVCATQSGCTASIVLPIQRSETL